MSLDTRTARRQARHRRNLVVGAVVGLATAVSAALVGAMLVAAGPDQPSSAASSVGPSSSGWPATADDVRGEAVTSAPTSSVQGPEDGTGTPAPSATAAATSAGPLPAADPVSAAGRASSAGPSPSADPTSPQAGRTVVTVMRTDREEPSSPPRPTPTASPRSSSDLPPGQLKRPKPKRTPPPRR